MKRVLSLLLLVVLPLSSVFGASAMSNSMSWNVIDAASGLPDNNVKGMVCLTDGRIAMRTATGLSFYDGCDFRSFPISSRVSYSLSDAVNTIATLYTDKEHRLWIKGQGALSAFDLTRDKFVNDVAAMLKGMGLTHKIRNFFIDGEGYAWVITDNGRLLTNRGMGSNAWRNIAVSTRRLTDINSACGNVWLAYNDGTLVALNGSNLKLKARKKLWQHTVEKRDFIKLAKCGNDMWIMWDHGAAVCKHGGINWEKKYEDNNHTFITMLPDASGNVYLGIRQQGLVTLRKDGGHELAPAFGTPTGRSVVDDVESIVRKGSCLFLGLHAKGLAVYNPFLQPFSFTPFGKATVSENSIYQIANGVGSTVNFSFSRDFISYDTRTGAMRRIPMPDKSDYVCSLTDSRQRTWVGTFRNGIYVVTNGGTKHYMQGGNVARDINYDVIRSFAEDSHGRIWMSFLGGIGFFDESKGRIVPIRDSRLRGIRDIYMIAFDKSGRLWATTDDGLLAFDVAKRRSWSASEDSRLSGLANYCKALLIDKSGLVWVGTYSGLYALDPASKHVWHFDESDGMPNDMVQGITEDRNHDIWVTTANGLCRVHRSKGNEFTFMTFDKQNRLSASDFMGNAAVTTREGNLIFGCSNGVYNISPDAIATPTYHGRPMMSSLTINNIGVQPGREYDGRIILDSALTATHWIILSHNQNFVSMNFSGLNFDEPRHTIFRYKLEGVDRKWNVVSPQDGICRTAYTDLHPGSYKLVVYSAGADGRWCDKPLTITILVKAPWWASWWAISLYVICTIAIIFLILSLKMRHDRRQMEEDKRRELEEMKYRFFTNISHEFRTLLTLIITPVGSLLRHTKDPEEYRQLNNVNKNAGDLLQLVNELLDFRKMEMNGERLHLQAGNMDEFAQYTTMKFSPLSEQKNISLSFHNEASGKLFMYFDRDKMAKIINNILSNAFKFTPSGGNVDVRLSKIEKNGRGYVRIAFADTGCGISAEDQKHVFDRFYRSEHEEGKHAGSGIGLNMVKEYINMLGGDISVKSELGKGSCFIVDIPTDLKAEPKPQPSESATQPATAPEKEEGKGAFADKTVLVVEDNDEFRAFLTGELGHIYNNVLTASDGSKGLTMAETNNPDIIVSDVMMPVLSGTEMCNRLKHNIETSHIPVILLTAWSTDEARAEGYRAGADAYIAKPFDMEVLLARINNLLEKQEKRINDFTHNDNLDPKTVADSTEDEKFLQQAIECITKNLESNDYTIDSLARDVLMSRMSLYRKMRALTGQTPADFIRTVRLKNAARLLKTGKYNVQEVCWKTGFASSQNFSKHFKQMFGSLPSQYK